MILQEDAESRRRETWSSKFQLARLLTLGVLRFQSTPWLSSCLSSGDIQFLEKKTREGGQIYLLESPYIQIELSKDDESLAMLSPNKTYYHLVRNELLFSLGIILLELGYDAPLEYLQRPEDIKDGHGPTSDYTDFFTARRLSIAAARELDARYGRLAKKCLDIDFGVGENLDSVELQDAIVKGIIDELDICLKLDTQINNLLLS